MRIKKIKNTSQENVILELGEGSTLSLPPGRSFQNVRVTNLDQIKDKVEVSSDLGEIRADNRNSHKLYD